MPACLVSSEDMEIALSRPLLVRMNGVLTPLPDPGAPLSHTISRGLWICGTAGSEGHEAVESIRGLPCTQSYIHSGAYLLELALKIAPAGIKNNLCFQLNLVGGRCKVRAGWQGLGGTRPQESGLHCSSSATVILERLEESLHR